MSKWLANGVSNGGGANVAKAATQSSLGVAGWRMAWRRRVGGG